MPSVLIVSGDNVTIDELHGIPVDAVFQYYPSRSKYTRKVPEGIVDYEEQTKALCRYGRQGLSLIFVQDRIVRHEVMDLSDENYAKYGTHFEELDTKGEGGSLVRTLEEYLSWRMDPTWALWGHTRTHTHAQTWILWRDDIHPTP